MYFFAEVSFLSLFLQWAEKSLTVWEWARKDWLLCFQKALRSRVDLVGRDDKIKDVAACVSKVYHLVQAGLPIMHRKICSSGSDYECVSQSIVSRLNLPDTIVESAVLVAMILLMSLKVLGKMKFELFLFEKLAGDYSDIFRISGCFAGNSSKIEYLAIKLDEALNW